MTKIADIINPEVFVPYVLEGITKNNALIDSGIVVIDPAMDALAMKGGTIITMPFWKELDGEDEVLSDTNPLTPGGITAGKDMARLHMRGKAFSVNDLAKALAGSDPMAAIAAQVSDFWKQREQHVLVSSLVGAFAAPSMAGLVHDVAAADCGANGANAVKINGEIVIDAATRLGDAAGKLTAFCMHSIPYSTLLKNDLIEFRPDSEGKAELPYYLGKRVIVDDTMPVEDCTNGKVYTTFLFGEGAVARGEGSAPTPTETDRDSLQGNDVLITRRHFIMHPRGIRWMEAVCAKESPTNVELKNASNWLRAYDQKLIRIVQLKTNG